jgi:hypothetical protein
MSGLNENFAKSISVILTFLFFMSDVSYANSPDRDSLRVPMGAGKRMQQTGEETRDAANELNSAKTEVGRLKNRALLEEMLKLRGLNNKERAQALEEFIADVDRLGDTSARFDDRAERLRNWGHLRPIAEEMLDEIRGPWPKDSDYGGKPGFDQTARNAIFGLAIGKDNELEVVGLDMGLLNRPGARYYLWIGEELKYFVAEKGRGAYLEEEKINKKEDRLIRDFVERHNIDFPFYVIAHIPGSALTQVPGMDPAPELRETDAYFKIHLRTTHATRLGNMPIVPLGLLKYSPGITFAKMRHEIKAYEAKFNGNNGEEQHREGLREELKELDAYIEAIEKAERVDPKELKRLIDEREDVVRQLKRPYIDIDEAGDYDSDTEKGGYGAVPMDGILGQGFVRNAI